MHDFMATSLPVATTTVMPPATVSVRDPTLDAVTSNDTAALQQPSKKLQRRLAKMQYRAHQKAARVEAAANGDDMSAFRQRKRRSQRDCNRHGALKQRLLAAGIDSNVATDAADESTAGAVQTTGKQRTETPPPEISYTTCTARTCGSGGSDCCLRVIAPYIHRFETFVKARWCGRELGDVLSNEFAGLPADYCQRAIARGLVRINGERKDASYIVRNGDLLVHVVHRHEPPVHLLGALAPATLAHAVVHYVGDDIVVVDKPSSVPVHPSGAYLHNSMTQLLQTECALPELFPVHRLDRLTSGLLLFSTSPVKARVLCDEIASGCVQKHYIARVVGEFPAVPSHLSEAERALASQHELFRYCVDASAAGLTEISSLERHGEVYWRLSAPIGCISAAEHLQGVTRDGSSKSAETLLRRLSYDGEHSVVECLPITGRTHQIRVHLQHLGYPIANDPVYGPDTAREVAADADARAHVVDSVVELEHQRVEFDNDNMATPGDASPATASDDDAVQCRAICPACRDGEQAVFSSTQRHCFTLWLHSFKYTSSTWAFEVPLPPWARSA